MHPIFSRKEGQHFDNQEQLLLLLMHFPLKIPKERFGNLRIDIANSL